MTKKNKDVEVEEVTKTAELIETVILRPRLKLTTEEFAVLEEHVRLMNEKNEIKAILIPFSCEVVEDAE